MSADLFAEFGSTSSSNTTSAQPPQPSDVQRATTFSFCDDLAAPPAPAQAPPQTTASISNAHQDDGDNDDWGDFEGDASSFEPAPLVKQDSFAFVATQATRARAPTLPPTLENVGY